MTRRHIPLDATQILRTLAKNQVDYVVIGGVAVQTYGHTRTTQDLDIVPRATERNLQRLGRALSELNARGVGKTEPEAVRIPPTGVLELDTDAGGLDVHLAPAGASAYEQLRDRALEVRLDGPVLVVSLDDLIAMKHAAGRPIDRSDVLALTEPGPPETERAR